MQIYNQKRQVYISEQRANKDYPKEGVKKGDKYFIVKKNNFSVRERFKDEESLNEKYPEISFSKRYSETIKLLKEFKKELQINEKLSIVKFLKSKDYD